MNFDFTQTKRQLIQRLATQMDADDITAYQYGRWGSAISKEFSSHIPGPTLYVSDILKGAAN